MEVEIKDAISHAKANVRAKFVEAFKAIYINNTVPNDFKSLGVPVAKHTLRNPSDLGLIISDEGFYIIFSDYEVKKNVCKLVLSNLHAIYRGECRTVKKRIQSHLFNSCYKSDYAKRESAFLKKQEKPGKDFYEQYWPACLKLKSGISGVNIDRIEYNSYTWVVVTHRMKGSSQDVREQAELAFDDVFGKPAASREYA